MLTRTRALRLAIVAATLILAITMPPRRAPSKEFSSRCQVTPCLMSRNGEPWLKTRDGDFEVLNTVFVNVKPEKTDVRLVVAGQDKPFVIEIRQLTGIEMANWYKVIFYLDGNALIRCDGPQVLDHSDFTRFLNLEEGDLSQSLCKPKPRAPQQEV